MIAKNPVIPTNNIYFRKLKGFRCSHRNKWLLLANSKISQKSLLLFEFYIDIFDFDFRHDSFGQFIVDFAHLAQLFKVSVNTIRTWNKELVDKGFIRRLYPKSVYEISNPKRYLSSGKWKGESTNCVREENNQQIEIILQNSANNFQYTRENIQGIVGFDSNSQIDESSKALGSSKVKSNLSKQSFGEEDREWITNNVGEDI